MRVLVIEDHAEMAETVATGLRRAQMAVDVALDGPSGLERALTTGYDRTPANCTSSRSIRGSRWRS